MARQKQLGEGSFEVQIMRQCSVYQPPCLGPSPFFRLGFTGVRAPAVEGNEARDVSLGLMGKSEATK